MEINTDYQVESWYNQWTDKWIAPSQDIIQVDQSLPLNQIIYSENVREGTNSFVFELYDTQLNQVFFFDIFMNKNENNYLGNMVYII